MTRRLPILPPAVAQFFPDEVIEQIEARRKARGCDKLSYVRRQALKSRLDRRLRHLMTVYPTLRDLPTDRREPIRKLALRGAEVAGPQTLVAADALVADLHAEAPWFREVSSFIMHRLRANIARGETGLVLPPLLLVGDPGCGKSQYALHLARLAGLPTHRIDVGSGSAGFRISGLEKGWSNAAPGMPVETVLASQIANPLFVVDEVDKAGIVEKSRGGATSVTTSLLEMLEPGTAARFECPTFRLPFDLSRLVWVLTANRLDDVPAPLRDRARVFRVPNPTGPDMLAVFDRQMRSVDDPDLVADARRRLAQSLATAPMSLRRLRAFIEAVRAYEVKPRLH